MNITITFRHVDTSEAIKTHAKEKCGKLQKFLRRPMRARVTLSLDKLKHVAEASVSSGGERFEAKEATSDMYAAIDKVMNKLERQIRGSHGAAQSKKRRGGATLRGGRNPEPLASGGRGRKKTAKKTKKAKKKR